MDADTEARVRELAREEIRAAAQLVASKPVAGEWLRRDDDWMERRVNGEMVAWVSPRGAWCVTRVQDTKPILESACSTVPIAMLAADAWARDNAHLLDWTLPPAPVQPVAPRELTPAEPRLCAHCHVRIASAEERAAERLPDGPRCWWPGNVVPPAVPQPAPSEDRDTSLAYACGAVAAAAVAIVDPTQPSDVVFRVVRDALAENGATQPAPDSWHDAAAWIEAWGPSVTEQPAPSATVDEVMAAVKPSWEGAVDRLRRALSALSPAQLRGMVDAIGGAK